MAETNDVKNGDHAPDTQQHEGKFGDTWDAEVSVPSVLWVTFGIAATTALFFVIGWWVNVEAVDMRAEEASVELPVPVAMENPGRRLPPGPRLQASPEHELVEMRHELDQLLYKYSWREKDAGLVRIPVDVAMDVVLDYEIVETAEAPPEAEVSEDIDAMDADAEAGEGVVNEEASS